MARKRHTKANKPRQQSNVQQLVVQPDYYEKFHCIGAECEDNCCSAGWRVEVDRATWLRYQACQQEPLSSRLRESIEVEARDDSSDPKSYASIRMLPSRRCPFLETDMLCTIQKELGFEALSDICASYPRIINQFGGQREYGLVVSCPEAARIVLLHPEPTALVMADANADLARRDNIAFKFLLGTQDAQVLNQLRVLILRMLQWRELSLGARMMLVGSLLDEVGRVRGNARSKKMVAILPALETYAALFADAAYVEAEFERLPGNLPRKLQCTTGFLADFLTTVDPRFKECMLAFVDGLLGGEGNEAGLNVNELLARYQTNYNDYYLPYFREKDFVFENYLVNEVLISMFPFGRGSTLELYRAMVFNLAIIQVMLVGMAGHYKGLNDVRVIQFIQTFARRSAHNDNYLRKLTEATTSKDSPSFVEVMWMLKER